MRGSWQCENVWEGCSRQRERRVQNPKMGERGFGVFKNLRAGFWGWRGGKGKMGSSGDGEGAGLTLRAAPGERACRGGNGGGEVSQEAPARVLRRLGDAQTRGVTCEQGEGMT